MPATAAETARHIDTKFHIAAMLRAATRRQLSIEKVCTEPGCDSLLSRVWATGWSDDVHVEYRLDPVKPDVVIRVGGNFQAIEVYAKSKVSPKKRMAFAEKGLLWIEVKAEERLYSGDRPWNASMPLRVTQHGDDADTVCGACRARIAVRERRAAEAAAAEVERAQIEAARRERAYLNRLDFRRFKLLDAYLPNGEWRRVTYRVGEQYEDGAFKEMVLLRTSHRATPNRDPLLLDNGAETIGVGAGPYTDQTRALFKRLVDEHISAMRQSRVEVDDHMFWSEFPSDQADHGPIHFMIMDRRRSYRDVKPPTRYRWNRSEKKWFLSDQLAHVDWNEFFKAL